MMAGSSRARPRGIEAKGATGGKAIRVRPQLCLVLAALLPATFLAPGARAQSDSGDDLRFRLRTSVELVLVPVTVKDGRGELVTGLEREEFRLFEDGREQPIRYFSLDPFPLSAVILVDSGLSPGAQAAVRATLPVLPSAFGPADEFALYVFDTYPRQVLGFTGEADKLRQALQGLAVEESPPTRTGVTGGPLSAGPRINTVPVGPGVGPTQPQAPKSVKSIDDALFEAGMALRGREPGRRRVIFIISDGRNSRLNTHSFDETRNLLLGEEVSVYAIGVDNARFALGRTVLSRYARATGGDAYTPMTEAGLANAYARIAEQARNQYTLVYAARPAPGGREYRRIEVRVRRPGLTLLARDGYFAGLPNR